MIRETPLLRQKVGKKQPIPYKHVPAVHTFLGIKLVIGFDNRLPIPKANTEYLGHDFFRLRKQCSLI